MNDQQRHAIKVATYKQAITKVGFSKVESVIGFMATAKFDLAKDAHDRQQAAYIVADYLADAQVYGERVAGVNEDGEITIYDVLKSLK